jgi:hypothetical protein
MIDTSTRSDHMPATGVTIENELSSRYYYTTFVSLRRVTKDL